MSSRKPYFPNRRSAIISSTVVVLLLFVAVFGIERNTENILKNYHSEVLASRSAVDELLSQRFDYAEALGLLLDDASKRDELSALVQAFTKTEDVETINVLYQELDTVLAALQPVLYLQPSYVRYAPYFDKLYTLEQELAIAINQYQELALRYNQQKTGMLFSLVVRKLDYENASLFSFGSALKGRP